MKALFAAFFIVLCHANSRAGVVAEETLGAISLSATDALSWSDAIRSANEMIRGFPAEQKIQDEVARSLLAKLVVILRYAPEHAQVVDAQHLFLKLASDRGKNVEDYLYDLFVAKADERQQLRERTLPAYSFLRFYRFNPHAAQKLSKLIVIALNGGHVKIEALGDSDDLVEAGVVSLALQELFRDAHANVWAWLAQYWQGIDEVENLPDGRFPVDIEKHREFARLLFRSWEKYINGMHGCSTESVAYASGELRFYAYNSTVALLSEDIRENIGATSDDWNKFKKFVQAAQNTR